MPSSFLPKPRVFIRVALEPVYNSLNSFSLLTSTEYLHGLNTWVIQTSASLTEARRHTNRLVFEGLYDALTLDLSVPDFPTYLKRLAEQDPNLICNRILECLRSRFSSRVASKEPHTAPDTMLLLNDLHTYLTCVEYVQTDVPFDPVLQAEVHALLHDTSALHHLLISHLEALWQDTFAVEWKRVQSSLRWQSEMFARSLDEEATLEETFHIFTGRQLPPDISRRLTGMKEITLIPSWHMGRKVTLWESRASGRIFFSEPPNYDVVALRATPVGRNELRARLATLADETRLRVLELLVQQDELSAQEIKVALGLSQSSISRHLKQLVAMQYLYERRGEGANKTYRLSYFYFVRTAHAIEQLIVAEEVRTIQMLEVHDLLLSHELRRFLDKSGKVVLWPPSKQRDKLLILDYLARFFEHGRVYSEKEVHDLLLLHTSVEDSAAFRRALYDYRFMNRTRDGSRYWLSMSEASEKDSDD